VTLPEQPFSLLRVLQPAGSSQQYTHVPASAPPPGPAPSYTYTTQYSQQQLPELADGLSTVHQLQGQQPATYQLVHSSQLAPMGGAGQASDSLRQVLVNQNGQVLVPVTLAPQGSIVAQRTQQLLPQPQQFFKLVPVQHQAAGNRVLLQVRGAASGGGGSYSLQPRQQQQQAATNLGFAMQPPPPPGRPPRALQPQPGSPSTASGRSSFDVAPPDAALEEPQLRTFTAHGQGPVFRAMDAQAPAPLLPPGLRPRQPTGP
jgi:hypothetical protein